MDATTGSVAVVGPGAIGTTVAAALHERARTPLLCGRTPRDELVLTTDDRTIVVPGPVEIDPRKVVREVDVVFLAVKATQLADSTPWLRALCGPRTVVCVLQNGIEQVQSVGPLLGAGTAVPAVVWFPAQRDADGQVRLRGEPRLTVPNVRSAEPVVRALAGTRLQIEVADDFHSLAWRKLLQNAAAGLMALTGRRSGMFAREDIAGLTLAYLRECLAVGRADGALLGDDVPAQILDGFRTASPDGGTSILTDRERGNPLEWEARNGIIRRRGREFAIGTPISDVVVPLLAAASDCPEVAASVENDRT
jgi:2-dehydropantoate 2-reductase